MPPDSGRSAPRTAVRLGPIKIASLVKNIIEFCANEKYHFIHCVGSLKRPVVIGVMVGQLSPHF